MAEPIRLVVNGTPIPQGSMRAFVVNGRARVAQGGDAARRQKLGDWRQAIADVARRYQEDHQVPLIEGPIYLTVSFLLPKPKSAPKWKRWVSTKPDLDKLLRALFDGLTGVIFRDDAQIVSVTASKGYAIGCPPQADVLIVDATDRERELAAAQPAAAPPNQPALI